MDLTEIQAAVLDYLKTYTLEHGYQPSIQDMCQHFKVRSPNGICGHLKALERKGRIRRSSGGFARCIEIVGGLKPKP